jgi:DNA polymerase III subunit epsilon
MDFVAIDVETANASRDSICEIGMARYVAGVVVEEWTTLINPKQSFIQRNIKIHGITAERVAGMPEFQDVVPQIRSFLDGNLAVSHGEFDRGAIRQSFERCGMHLEDLSWIDTARVAKHCWSEPRLKNYRLATICEMLGHEYQKHNALADAKAAGLVLIQATAVRGAQVTDWLKIASVGLGVSGSTPARRRFVHRESLSRSGDPSGKYFGQEIVFTGDFSIPQPQIADIAALMGFDVRDAVRNSTDVLVVGPNPSRPNKKSTKFLQAEERIAKGISIQIIDESDFWAMANAPEV